MGHALILGFLLFFLVWFFLRTCYLVALKPFLQDKARYRLFALRDQLRRCEITTHGNRNTFSIRFLENVLNAGILSVEEISIGTVIESKYLKSSDTEVKIRKDLSRFDREASAELKEIDSAFFETMLFAIKVNSPVLCVVFYCSRMFGDVVGSEEDARAVAHSYRPLNGASRLQPA